MSALPACPLPVDRYPSITTAHGGGGRLMKQLVEELFEAALGSAPGVIRHDGAILSDLAGPLAFTTDGFVVRPLDFPGGCIGSLCVYGTANDLAMCGARPRYLSLGVILEEGLPMQTLWRQVVALARAAEHVGVRVVTGDTKVVERGHGDGMFVHTSGVGELLPGAHIDPASVRPGDAIVVSGDLGRHGIAVMAAREGFELEGALESDCGSLVAPALSLLEAGLEVHCMRDLTRGGLASGMHEVAASSGTQMRLRESAIRVSRPVQDACELLGLDPLHVANEGRFAIWLPEAEAQRAIEILRGQAISHDAARVGSVLAAGRGASPVVLELPYGSTRVLDMLSGEQLPRIC